jgi:arylsulfatase A-like enzyme
LARGGIKFTEAYLTASSCSPSRSSIITGRYPHNNGKAAELHQPIAWNLPWFPALLREAGYYTALSGKNHMSSGPVPAGQTAQPRAFDSIDAGRVKGNSGGHGNWVQVVKDRPQDKPFFFWFASYDAHRGWDGDQQWDADRYGPKHQPEDVVVPPFLSDDPATRQDLASYYNEVTRFDYYIGQVVKTLGEQGALDNTLLLVMADNGRPFPRAKTRLHDSGMKTALVAHWPAGIGQGGSTCNSLVSAIDLAPTFLGLAGVKPPETMQGVSMQPLFADPATTIRRYAFSEHNWHDYEAHGRSVRGDGFLYLRNFRPQFAWQGPADSVRSPSHVKLRALRDAGKLTDAQADVFLAPRPDVELYRLDTDPYQLENVALDPAYHKTRQHLGNVLDQWMDETGDSVPENLSRDSFDRETGNSLKVSNYRGTTPGEDRSATQINAAGPR